MDDADIIPIGTHGAAGRGAGAKPSKAARDLLGGGRRTPPAPRAAEGADVHPLAPAAEPPAAAESLTLPGTGGGAAGSAAAAGGAKRPGIPVTEIVDAFTHAAMEVFGEDWERKLAHFIAFLRRRITGEFEVDDYGFDPELTERLLMTAARPLAEKWFRIEVRGIENIPKSGGALIVSNHSGTVPVDAIMTMFQVHERTGRHLRPLGADLVFRLPFVSTVARRGGVTLACQEDAERMLNGGELVGVWPEGFKGIGKPFSERYKLQRFGRGGFVGAALRTSVPIIPVSVVGAEEIYPLVGNVPSLARLFGLPYVPITPFFPLLGPLGLVPLPSKWIIEFGEPIRTDEFDPSAAEDPLTVFEVTDRVRETIQQTLYQLLMRRRSIFG
ncbi:lysophospholipid acyltransferase family protein [Nocardioides jiangxiensis]|uniref:Lysophospholipid acyltransferase family protein n=1 Tax=Nocardioides jiangxiensis TaxID=3064524 RepID=A0ABT9B1I0_9ACTN|nr:lysophospholipid acyltransferase family protein [Nocardioides sp. WY-20]MDO7868582.1 lysophospholipid acyltransferase family protein [Nocardioides sp. WY-20]